MAQTFKAKTLLAASGRFSHEAIAPNLIYNTGDQNISGIKNFYSRPTVNGTGVLLSGEAASLPITIVYTTGDQAISGNKTFNNNVVISENLNVTGSIRAKNIIATESENLLISGYSSFMFGTDINIIPGISSFSIGKINLTAAGDQVQGNINLKGNVDVNNYGDNFSGPSAVPSGLGHKFTIYKSGLNLYNQNASFKSFEVNQSGVYTLNKTPIYSDGQIYISGNSVLTGVDLSSYATVANLASTGSSLDNKINSLSGNLTSNYATIINLVSTGSTLNTKINNLSGYINSSESNIVFTTGGQNISGIKNFYSRPTVNGTGVLLSGEAASLPTTIVYTTGNQTISGVKTFANNLEVQGTGIFNALDLSNISEFNFSGTNINLINGNVNISGGTIYISGSPVLTGVNLTSYATIGNLASTGSTLDSKINALSGNNYLTSSSASTTYATISNLATTGSTLNNSIISLSGLFTGFTGALDTAFASDAQLYNTGSTLDSKINSLSGNLTSTYATITNLANTGSTLDTKINSLSGYSASINNLQSTGSNLYSMLTGFSGNLDATYATDIQLYNTGSTLDTKINTLSGYVTGTNSTFTTNLFSTGSTLNTKINNLSGYINSSESNIVFTTGNQTISGNKTFLNNINVSGSGIFNALDLNNIDTLNFSGVDISITDGNVVLTNRPTVNGTGVVLSGELASTGSALANKINSLSGYVNSQDIVFSGQIALTGSNLYNNIISLSGIFTGYTGTLNANFASNLQLYNTGNTLDQKINSLSGYSASIINLTNTGSILDSKINSLSGNLTSTYATIINLFSTGSTLDNKINSLSGSSVSVSNLALTGSTLDSKINSLSGNLTSNYATITNLTSTGSTLNNNIISLSGYVTGTDATLTTNLASTGSTLNIRINNLSGFVTGLTGSFVTSTNLFSTGSTLDTKINSLSGYVTGTNSTFTTNLASTGSTLNTKINNLSGYINSSASNIVFTTGNQIISGIKTFAENTTFGDTGQGDFLVISGNNFTVYGSGNFTSGLFINGNAVLTGVDLSSYATLVNLASTGSTLNTKINSLSGYSASAANLTSTGITLISNLFNTGSNLNTKIDNLSGYVTGSTGTFASIINLTSTGSTLNLKINSLSGYVTGADATFATITNLASTGSTVDTKINTLSGYVTGANATFASITNLALTGSTLNNSIISLSGLFTGYTGALDAIFASDAQLFTTGSTLNTRINNLSGYINSSSSNIVYTTGNQSINGFKTFAGNIALSYISGSLTNNASIALGDDDDITISAGNQAYINSPYIQTSPASLGATVLFGDYNQDSPLQFVNIHGGNLLVDHTGIFLSGIDLKNSKLNNASNVIYNTGNQTISGAKSFSDRITFLNSTATYPFNPTISGGASIDNEATLDIDAFKLNLRAGYGKSDYIELGGEEGRLNINTVADTSTFNLGYSHNSSSTGTYNITSPSINLYGQVNGQTGTFQKLYADNLVYNTGNQTISGVKTFDVFPIVSGNKLITGVDLSSYSTVSNLFATGSTLNNKINFLSGYVTGITGTFGTLPANLYATGSNLYSMLTGFSGNLDATYATDSQLTNTGSTLDIKINSLSGNLTSTYATISNLSLTGSNLNSKVNSLSGNLTSTYATINNLISTGSILNSSIISLSGLFTGYTGNLDAIFASDAQLFATGSTLNTKINNLSGYINNSSSNIVYTTGNQTISGNKNFYGDILLSGSNNRIGSNHYLSTDGDFVYIRQADGNFIFSTEESLLWDMNQVRSIDWGGRSLVGSNDAESIGWNERYLANQNGAPVLTWTGDNIGIGTNTPTEKLQVDGNIRLNNNGGLYIYDQPNGSDNRIVWQDNELLFQNDFDYSNKQAGLLFGSGPLGENVLYSFMGGSQNTNLSIPSGRNGYIAVNQDLLDTGSNLNNKINSLSGNLTATYSTISNLESTGSTLHTKINNLSGYVNSTSSNIVFTTGNQTISGVKTFTNRINTSEIVGNVLLISGDDFDIRGGSYVFMEANDVLSFQSPQIGLKTDYNENNVDDFIGIQINSQALGGKSIDFRGTGVFWSGIDLKNSKLNNASNVIYNTGNQAISGNKTFNNTLSVRTISGLSGVDGPISIDIKAIDNAFNVFGSSYIGGNIYATAGSGNIAGGSISLRAGKYGNTEYGGNIDAIASNIFINNENTAARNITIYKTGVGTPTSNISISQTSVNVQNTFTISGVAVTPSLYATSTNLASTGSTLVSSINSLSGTLTSTYATITNLASTGSTLDSKINNLSGTAVLTFGNQTLSGLKTFTNTGTFNSGIDLNNSNLINATPQIINLSANFNISGNYNSRMIMVNSANEVTGRIVSGNALGFNATIMQVGSGQILITGSGIGIRVNEYANQFRTAGAFAAVTILHTGSNGYVMYGNTAS